VNNTDQQALNINPPLGAERPLPDLGEIERTRIQPSSGWVSLQLRELWRYRELLVFFVWRDVKVRYKQTILGMAWAIIQPFFTMVIFSLFFGRLAEVPSDGLPYPVFSYAALVPWTLFANALTQASNSLIVGANMIKKIYFPRLTMPIATVLAAVVDFALAFIVLLGMMLYFGLAPTTNALWLPLFLLLALVTSLGVGLWLSALNVQFRDVRYAVPFLTQAWLFATPIAYPSARILAAVLRSQSHGWRRGGLPLGFTGYGIGAQRDGRSFGARRSGVPNQWDILLPPYGKDIC
jgi:lipopolysaccharide transport system permease protein